MWICFFSSSSSSSSSGPPAAARFVVAVDAFVEEEEVNAFGGIARGANRVEYADGAFIVRHAGRDEGGGHRELHVNAHRVKTRAKWQFWGEEVQCLAELYVGKDGNEVEVGERLKSAFANVENLAQHVSEENADLRAENAELLAKFNALKAKVDNFFQPPSPPPPPSPLTPIPDASWHTFVEECLTEAPETGECTVWASGNNYGTMPDWDVSEVTDMSGWNNGPTGFHGTMGYQGFNADITRWDTSGLKTMQAMFENTQSFQRDIGVWNTSGVTNMWATFKNSAFNRDISGWNTSSVTVMKAMFLDNTAFNQDISSWNGTAAETEQLRIFEGATAFQAKFSCTNIETGPVNSCELKST